MTQTPTADGLELSNDALSLSWRDGALHVKNHLSGCARVLDFPAFALELSGERLGPEGFTLEVAEARPDGVTFSYTHAEAGVRATVTYSLQGDEPWFRKRVNLRGPDGAPTPGRLWVDRQLAPPEPIRRVGYGLRGGPDGGEQSGLDTYAAQPGCGYPVYAGDWFIGLEHPAGFTVPGDGLELCQHPTWGEDGTIESFAAVYGAAADHSHVPAAFMDYVWNIRNPRLTAPFITMTVGWSTRYLGAGEYLESFESEEAFFEGMLELGLRPDAFALDAGYFDRRSLYRHKTDDEDDTRFLALRDRVAEEGMDLALWVSHNGPVGFDMEWIKAQGWKTGEGPGTPYCSGEFVVMMQPEFEDALGARFEELVGRLGTRHLKIDWDNECATCGEFAGRYPTPEHVREETIKAFNRIDGRMRARNPELITRNGWWPSPWWLAGADHVWLVDSGDCEYASWPSRTQRDRDITHRDASYHQIFQRAETPLPLDAIDNHGFADALANPFADKPHTWLNNVVLGFTRGTTYLHVTVCPEDMRQWQADTLQQALEWMRFHADELGTPGTHMVGGSPAAGEVYGFLHPSADSAWLVVRNPSPEPQRFWVSVADWIGYAPRTIRQVYPFWQDLEPLKAITLLGHGVRLIWLEARETPDPSPIPGAPFMVEAGQASFDFSFPGARPLADGIGPTAHESMQMPEIVADETFADAIEGGRRLQWHVGIPHRMERPELYLRLRGAQVALDAADIQVRLDRYRTGDRGHTIAAQRIFRNEGRGHGTSKWLPPVGPRDRDDYAFGLHDGGYASITADITGDACEELQIDAWITGWEAPARRTIQGEAGPADGPLLPVHPYGFPRCVRL